jgi:hypothetical protein
MDSICRYKERFLILVAFMSLVFSCAAARYRRTGKPFTRSSFCIFIIAGRRKMLAQQEVTQREVGSSGGTSLAGSTDVRIQVFEMGELLSKIMYSFGNAFGLAQLYRVFLAISPHMRSLLKGPADSVRERWVHGMQPAYMASQFSKYYKMPRRRAMSIIEECFLVSRMQQSFLATNIAQSLLTQAMQSTLQGQELSCLPGVYPLCVAGIIF